jgi:CRP-like cAMP-binding protein
MMIPTKVLRRYPLFTGLDPYLLEEIALISEEIEIEEGEWLFYEESDANHFYIVTEGSISLTINIFYKGKAEDIEATEPIMTGQMLGWSALIRPHKYKFGGRGAEKSRLIAIDAQPFRELLDDNPDYGYRLVKNVAEAIGERLVGKCIQFLSLVIDPQEVQKQEKRSI